jgi:hypothetical protein
MKDISDKIMTLEYDEVPLYTLKRRMVKGATHVWLEDELNPFPHIDIIQLEANMGKRICPNFIICGYKHCKYYKPDRMYVRTIRCSGYPQSELMDDNIKLVDVEE